MQAPGSVGVPPPMPPTVGRGGSGSALADDSGFSSKVTTSTGGKGQFIIHGKDLQTRGPFSARCGDIAEGLRRLLKDDEPWVLPIVVALKTAPDLVLADPPVKTSISKITSGGFHLQVTVQIRPDLRPAALDAEITRILIAERILRNHAEITTKRSMVLPDWLLTGVSQAMTFRDRSRPSAVFAAIFRSGKIYSIEEILDTAPGELDALSRTLYETSCCALVLALLDQVDGPMRLRKFLSMLAVDSRDDRELLNFCFPTLALSSSSLNKWWSLQMASLATPTVFETLGPTETQKALTEALTLRYETTVESAPKRSTAAPAEIAAAEETPEEKKQPLLVRLLGSAPEEKEAKKAEVKKADAPPAAKPKPDSESTAEEKKPGFLGRMFGASGDTEKEPESGDKAEKTEPKAKEKETPKVETPKKPEPPKEEKPKEKKAEPDSESTAEEKKPGFLGRMFAPTDNSEKEAEPAKKEEKPEPKAKEKEAPKVEAPKKPEPPKEEKPKTKPETKEEPAEPKKRGFFERFLGTDADSKIKEETKEESTKSGKGKADAKTEKPKEEKAASVLSDSTDVTAMFVPSSHAALKGPVLSAEHAAELQSLWTAFFTESSLIWSAILPESGTPVILGFGKKKTEEESKAEEPKKGEPKKEEPAKAKEPKPTRKELKEAKEAEKAKEVEKSKKEEAEKEKEKKAEATPPAKTTPAKTSPAKTSSTPAKAKLVSVSVPIEEYDNILKRKDRASILDRNAKALAALAQRGNVLFRPLINDYIAVIADLQLAKTKDMSSRLAALKTKASEAYARAKAVEDHLDWYEASETQNYSGTFEDYLRLPEQIQKELPLRDDPISQYLDEVEREIGQ
jgi:hypothetical protein